MVGNYKRSIRAHVTGELEQNRFDKRWDILVTKGGFKRKIWRENRRGYKG